MLDRMRALNVSKEALNHKKKENKSIYIYIYCIRKYQSQTTTTITTNYCNKEAYKLLYLHNKILTFYSILRAARGKKHNIMNLMATVVAFIHK